MGALDQVRRFLHAVARELEDDIDRLTRLLPTGGRAIRTVRCVSRLSVSMRPRRRIDHVEHKLTPVQSILSFFPDHRF
jgi:hypothetical protein